MDLITTLFFGAGFAYFAIPAIFTFLVHAAQTVRWAVEGRIEIFAPPYTWSAEGPQSEWTDGHGDPGRYYTFAREYGHAREEFMGQVGMGVQAGYCAYRLILAILAGWVASWLLLPATIGLAIYAAMYWSDVDAGLENLKTKVREGVQRLAEAGAHLGDAEKKTDG